MSKSRIELVRERLRFYLLPQMTRVTGLSLHQMQQFIVGRYQPTDAQLAAMARYMGLT